MSSLNHNNKTNSTRCFFSPFQLNLQLKNEVTERSGKDCLQAEIFWDMPDFLLRLHRLSDLKLLSERTDPMVLDPEGRKIIPFAFIMHKIKHLV